MSRFRMRSGTLMAVSFGVGLVSRVLILASAILASAGLMPESGGGWRLQRLEASMVMAVALQNELPHWAMAHFWI